jgi:hypothetical protein
MIRNPEKGSKRGGCGVHKEVNELLNILEEPDISQYEHESPRFAGFNDFNDL